MELRHIKNRSLVNFRMLVRILWWILGIEGDFMLFPAATSAFYGESDYLPFLIVACLALFSGAVMARRSKPRFEHLGRRDGYLLTASVWVVFSVFGMLPFIFSSAQASVSDAFFEAMSGFTTTGASVLVGTENLSHGVHLWRAMMQWVGGMGIILFTLAIIPMLNHSGGMQMFNAEVTGITHDKIQPRISQTAKSLWTIYLVLTVVLVLLLWAGPMNLFESVCHAFGTISTGGYSTSPDSIHAWDSVYIKIVMIIFMFLGGVNFALIYRFIHGDFHTFRRNDVLRTYLIVIGLTLVMFVISIIYRRQVYDWQSVTVDPLFQIVSTITSTGFTVVNFENWGSFVLAVTFVLMFSGACAGSTSGGAKIDRLLYLFKNAHNEIYRCIHPRAIRSVKVNGKVVNTELVNKVIAFLCIYMLLVVGGGIILASMGVPVVDAFFSAFSCLSNTGLGAGVTGVGSGYEILPDAAKWVLSALMLVGRLEIFTVLVILTPTFWRH